MDVFNYTIHISGSKLTECLEIDILGKLSASASIKLKKCVEQTERNSSKLDIIVTNERKSQLILKIVIFQRN